MQIYATIRNESKYRHQQAYDAQHNPIPFKVFIEIENDQYWPVKGGIGGNYALYDVDLWIKDGGRFEKLPVHNVFS